MVSVRCDGNDPRHGVRRMTILLATAAFMLLGVSAAIAQDFGDAEAGHQLAKQWCAACHVVDTAQTRGSATGAPPFAAVAAMKSTTRLSLSAFLQTPHVRMPDFRLSRTQIDDVSAYILSLGEK